MIKDSQRADELTLTAHQKRLNEAQAHLESCANMFNRTAGKVDNDRETAEKNRQNQDEKKHMMRTDAYYGQRERARERQRQGMVAELDRQTDAINNRNRMD